MAVLDLVELVAVNTGQPGQLGLIEARPFALGGKPLPDCVGSVSASGHLDSRPPLNGEMAVIRAILARLAPCVNATARLPLHREHEDPRGAARRVRQIAGKCSAAGQGCAAERGRALAAAAIACARSMPEVATPPPGDPGR